MENKRILQLRKYLHEIEKNAGIIQKELFGHINPVSFLGDSIEYENGKIGNRPNFLCWQAACKVFESSTGTEMNDLFSEMIDEGIIKDFVYI